MTAFRGFFSQYTNVSFDATVGGHLRDVEEEVQSWKRKTLMLQVQNDCSNQTDSALSCKAATETSQPFGKASSKTRSNCSISSSTS